VFRDTEHAANLFALREMGWIYTRLMNPTTDVFEQRLAALDGASAAWRFQRAAGHRRGHVQSGPCRNALVSAAALYGGTITLFSQTFKRLGIDVTFVDATKPDAIAAAIRPNTRAVYIESLANPKNDVLDYEAVPRWPTHTACRWSATTPCSRRSSSGPSTMASTSPSTALRSSSVDTARASAARSSTAASSIGAASRPGGRNSPRRRRLPRYGLPRGGWPTLLHSSLPDELAARPGRRLKPFNSFLFLQGLETLHLRMPRHSENALAVAKFLESHPMVTWVNYPGLAAHPGYKLAKRYCPRHRRDLASASAAGGRRPRSSSSR